MLVVADDLLEVASELIIKKDIQIALLRATDRLRQSLSWSLIREQS